MAIPDRASIMVVEDNPTDVFLVGEAIATYGLHVELKVVEDGEEAISLIARIEANESEPCPSLILLDLNLPGKDGFEVLSRLRQSTRCARTRVIVMSSSGAPADRDRSMSLGADAYFQKRVDYDASMQIGGIIQKFLE